MQDKQSKTESPAAVGSTPLLGQFGIYCISTGALISTGETVREAWLNYYHDTDTGPQDADDDHEWRTLGCPNVPAQRPPAIDV